MAFCLAYFLFDICAFMWSRIFPELELLLELEPEELDLELELELPELLVLLLALDEFDELEPRWELGRLSMTDPRSVSILTFCKL